MSPTVAFVTGGILGFLAGLVAGVLGLIFYAWRD